MNNLSPSYWSERYQNDTTGWDIGHANFGLTGYVTKHFKTSDSILIPGAGRAHEALYLWQKGYENLFVLDWAPEAFESLKEAVKADPSLRQFISTDDHFIVDDFFTHRGGYDLILEQTFFCAIDPKLRKSYAKQVFELLSPKGKLVGIFFNREFPTAGPPFGGSKEEYAQLFSPYFNIEHLQLFKDSISPRLGYELLCVMNCRSDV